MVFEKFLSLIIIHGHWKEIEPTFAWRLELIMTSSIIIIVRLLLYVHHCTIMIHLLFFTSQNMEPATTTMGSQSDATVDDNVILATL